MRDIKNLKKTITCVAAVMIVMGAAALFFTGNITSAEFTSYTTITLGALYGVMNKFMADSEKERATSLANSVAELVKTKDKLEKENKDLSKRYTDEMMKRVAAESDLITYRFRVEEEAAKTDVKKSRTKKDK